MIETPPPAYHARGAGAAPALLVLCAATGLAALAALHLSVFGVLQARLHVPEQDGWTGYVPLAVAALALVYWRLAPRQAWFVLLLAGALAAIPVPLLVIAPDLFTEWMAEPYLVLFGACRPLLLVGTLALATWVWRTGRRDAGAVLIGAAVAVPVLAGLVGAILFTNVDRIVLAVIGLVLAGVCLVVTIVAGASGGPARTDEAEPRPTWAATIGGAVGAVAPLLFQAWPASMNPSADSYAAFGEHMLVVGLIVLAAGVIGGIAAGPRVLTVGLAIGSLLGAVAALVGSAAAGVLDLPTALPVTVVVLSLAAGIAVGVLRARLVVGLGGLGLLVIGLLVLYLVFLADDPIFDNDVMNVLTPILLVVGIVSIIAVLAANGAVLAPFGEAPAAVAGVGAAVAAGLSGVITYFAYNPLADTAEIFAGYPPVIVLIVFAAALTIVAHQRWYRPAPPVGEQPAQTVPVGETGPEPPVGDVR